ncbi:MAG: TIR domain-containing protein [Chloroflexota bacterium]
MTNTDHSAEAKRICIGFDWTNDWDSRQLLGAWLANHKIPATFTDLSAGQLNDNVAKVKARLSAQIRAATHTLVLVGAYANTRHQLGERIGTRNWIWWEIEQSKAEGKRLIAVKLKAGNPTPDPLLNADVTWATSFTQEAILAVSTDA